MKRLNTPLMTMILVAVMCLAGCKAKEILTGDIKGSVTDAQTSLPLSDAKVVIETTTDTITTGSDGQYLFKDLDDGTYDVKALKLTYETKTSSVAVTPAKTTELNFALNGVPVAKVSQRYLDFGLDSITRNFQLSNIGRSILNYSLVADQSWITVNPASGTVESETDKITVTINKTGYENITLRGLVRIMAAGKGTIDSVIIYANGVLDSENHYYNVIKIGDQTWMAQNLNLGVMKSGGINLTDFPEINKYCYGNTDQNCNTYGALYTWPEIMQGAASDTALTGTTQGVCPTGWHLPTLKEWNTMILFLEEAVAAVKLKEAGSTHWKSPNRADNESGFTALPGGMWDGYYFSLMTTHGYFWTATADPGPVQSSPRYCAQMDWTGEKVFFQHYTDGEAASVRCVKNK